MKSLKNKAIEAELLKMKINRKRWFQIALQIIKLCCEFSHYDVGITTADIEKERRSNRIV